MVTQFPIDPMHLVYPGVVKRIIWLWIKGSITTKCRLGSCIIQEISSNLLLLRDFVPREFARKCRSLSDMKRWKATEFRLFLLYVGPVALKDKIDDETYKHFMLLFTGIYCLTSPSLLKTHCEYAHRILCKFVEHFHTFYIYLQNILV